MIFLLKYSQNTSLNNILETKNKINNHWNKKIQIYYVKNNWPTLSINSSSATVSNQINYNKIFLITKLIMLR